ncbi:MAG: hypothetical protein GX575_20135 [Candidatus Anammoximicrobium sp.]|nr:hypothetical protein [Candidatus Anammoximicrobium sp.]
MKRTDFPKYEGPDSRQERPAAERRRWVRGLAIAGLGGFTIGLLAAGQVGRLADTIGTPWRQPARHTAGAPDAGLTPHLVEQYRQELIRLTQTRGEEAAVQREKQLTLQILKARGVNRDAPSFGRLEREVCALQAKLAGTDDRLARLREQLAKLTAVKSAAEHQEGGLDVQTEIEARRVVLEYDAGMPTE